MMKRSIIAISAGSAIVGAAISFVATFFTVKAVMEKKHADELDELRDVYQEKLKEAKNGASRPSTTPDTKEESRTPADIDDNVLTGHVDTHKTDYAACYNRNKERISRIKDHKNDSEETAYPVEDDVEDEPDVEEITEMDDDLTGKPGYGNMPGYDAIEMALYTYDNSLDVTSWGDYDEKYMSRTDEQIIDDEVNVCNDILPYLDEMEFISEPYDIVFIRDHRRAIDARIIKRAGTRDDYYKK